MSKRKAWLKIALTTILVMGVVAIVWQFVQKPILGTLALQSRITGQTSGGNGPARPIANLSNSSQPKVTEPVSSQPISSQPSFDQSTEAMFAARVSDLRQFIQQIIDQLTQAQANQQQQPVVIQQT